MLIKSPRRAPGTLTPEELVQENHRKGAYLVFGGIVLLSWVGWCLVQMVDGYTPTGPSTIWTTTALSPAEIPLGLVLLIGGIVWFFSKKDWFAPKQGGE